MSNESITVSSINYTKCRHPATVEYERKKKKQINVDEGGEIQRYNVFAFIRQRSSGTIRRYFDIFLMSKVKYFKKHI